MTAGHGTPLLELAGITKAFPKCLANDDVSFAIQPGEIHALLGENGAGKSTLVKIIYGVLLPDRGELRWNGRPVAVAGPAMARQLGIGQKEAKAYIETYFERYPGIKDYMERVRAECRRTGRVETLYGRRIHLPGINDKNHMRRGYAERQAINAPIQGSAADIIKRAMIRVPAALKKHKLEADMLLQVHDELLFEVPEKQIDHTIETVGAVMEGAAGPAVTLDVPLVVEAGIGDNWDEAH